MKRMQVYAASILLALVPAVFGLWGNASFSQAVPIRVPVQAHANGARQVAGAGGVHAAHHAGTARQGADDPAGHDAGDDHGGERRTSGRAEPGDDHGSSTQGSNSGTGSASSGQGSQGADDRTTARTTQRDASGSGRSPRAGRHTGGGGHHSGGDDDKEPGGHGSDD